MAGINEFKVKGVDASNNEGNLDAVAYSFNTGDGGDKGNKKVEIEDIKATDNKGNAKVLTDLGNEGKVPESGRQELVKTQK
ncbi:hypothetical protein ACE6H2_020426 [Prunus campanulata]